MSSRTIIGAIMALVLLVPVVAVQTDDMPDTRIQALQLAVAVLAATMAAVFDAAAEEDVSAEFRAILQEAIAVCLRIVAAMGYVR